MLRLLLLFCISILSQTAFSQVGIFRTYKDFKNNKVEEYYGPVTVFHAVGRFKISFRDKDGNKVKFKANHKEMWGYRDEDGYIYRINKKNDPYLMVEMGKLCVYTNYSTRFNEAEGEISFNNNQFYPHISKGANGEMMYLKKKNVKKLIAKDKQGLKDFKKVTFGVQALYEFAVEYNKRFRKE